MVARLSQIFAACLVIARSSATGKLGPLIACPARMSLGRLQRRSALGNRPRSGFRALKTAFLALRRGWIQVKSWFLPTFGFGLLLPSCPRFGRLLRHVTDIPTRICASDVCQIVGRANALEMSVCIEFTHTINRCIHLRRMRAGNVGSFPHFCRRFAGPRPRRQRPSDACQNASDACVNVG
jgi:hypothetical protein